MKTRREILQKRVMEYKQARKKEKGEILGEVQKITGYNRKYAIALITKLGKTISAIMDGKPDHQTV
ncbi:MAG: hypothetical protein JW969_00600 [Spirochaetales bacterium]|nr:hypothetical protein [Spirochaetales bacterium]